MTEVVSDFDSRHKVWEMIKDIRVCQMVTRDVDGHLHARPMVAQQERFDGELWFFTWAHSEKVKEIETYPHVALSYSDPKQQNYVSVSGRARLVLDRARMEEFWAEPLRTWFPKGIDDPNMALICVTIESAEYWDSPSSTVVYAYGYAKARLTGKAPNPGENKIVEFETA
jgi:general stress protein 26